MAQARLQHKTPPDSNHLTPFSCPYLCHLSHSMRRGAERCRLMTVISVVVFLVDCALVEMCFNQIIAKQWMLLWFRYLQPIMFNVKDNSQTITHQTALACQAPLRWDMLLDPAAGELHFHYQGSIWTPPATLSTATFCSIAGLCISSWLLHTSLWFFSRAGDWDEGKEPCTLIRGLIWSTIVAVLWWKRA